MFSRPPPKAQPNVRSSFSLYVIIGAGSAALPLPAFAQPTPSNSSGQSSSETPATQAPVPVSDEDEVVVVGKPPRGSAIGDIPPLNVLHSRDVRATGATSFDELLDAIAPQIGG